MRRSSASTSSCGISSIEKADHGAEPERSKLLFAEPLTNGAFMHWLLSYEFWHPALKLPLLRDKRSISKEDSYSITNHYFLFVFGMSCFQTFFSQTRAAAMRSEEVGKQHAHFLAYHLQVSGNWGMCGIFVSCYTHIRGACITSG